MLTSGWAMRKTWQCSGAVAEAGVRVALMTERSGLVRLSSWRQVVTGFAVAGGGVQSRNWTAPPPWAIAAVAARRRVIKGRMGVLRWFILSESGVRQTPMKTFTL